MALQKLFRGKGEVTLLMLAKCKQNIQLFTSQATSTHQNRDYQKPQKAPAPSHWSSQKMGFNCTWKGTQSFVRWTEVAESWWTTRDHGSQNGWGWEWPWVSCSTPAVGRDTFHAQSHPSNSSSRDWKLALLCCVPGLSRSCHLHTHFTFCLPHKSSFGISLPQVNQKGKQSPQIKCAPYSLTKREHSSSCHQDYKHIILLCRSSWLARSNQVTGLQHTSSVWSQKLTSSASASTLPCWQHNHSQSFQDGITWLYRIA